MFQKITWFMFHKILFFSRKIFIIQLFVLNGALGSGDSVRISFGSTFHTKSNTPTKGFGHACSARLLYGFRRQRRSGLNFYRFQFHTKSILHTNPYVRIRQCMRSTIRRRKQRHQCSRFMCFKIF